MLRTSLPHLRFSIIFVKALGNFSFSFQTLASSISVILSHWNTRCPTEGWITKKHTAACRNVMLEYHFCSPSSHRYWHICYWVTVVSHMGHLTWEASLHWRVLPHSLLHSFPLSSFCLAIREPGCRLLLWTSSILKRYKKRLSSARWALILPWLPMLFLSGTGPWTFPWNFSHPLPLCLPMIL